MVLKVIFVLLGFIVINNAMKSYENYKVYNIVPNNENQVQILTDLKKDGYDFWSDVVTVDNDVRIMVPPHKDEEFVKYVQSVGLNADLRITNVQE